MIPFIIRLPECDRKTYRIDLLAAVYFGLHMGFLVPFIPVLLKRLGANPFQMGLSIAAPFLGLVLVFPLYRFLPSATKAVDLITIPSFFARLSICFLGFLVKPWPILALSLLGQFVEAIGFSSQAVLLKAMYSEEGRPLAMGYVRAFLGIFQIIGSILGGLMLDAGQGEVLFILSGICGAISALTFRLAFRAGNSPFFSANRVQFSDIIQTNNKSSPFFWFNVTIMAFGFGNLLTIGVLPTMLVEKFNISNTALGYLNGLTYITLVLSYLFIGKYILRFGVQSSMLFAMLAGLFNSWLFLLLPSVVSLALPFALNGIMFAGFDISWSIIIIKIAPESEISKFSSVYTLLMGFRGIIAVMVSNLAIPFLGTSAILMAGGVTTFAGMAIAYTKRSQWNPQ